MVWDSGRGCRAFDGIVVSIAHISDSSFYSGCASEIASIQTKVPAEGTEEIEGVLKQDLL